jgi:hypothetical protein
MNMEEKTGQDADVTAAPLTGRAKVRALLIEPLEAEGLKRPGGKANTPATHAAFLDRLQDRLAYLNEEQLAVLRSIILRMADGPQFDRWPSYATILNNAHRLVPPPDAPIVTSWLGSVEGPRAEAGGFLVELYQWLVKHGRPPLSWDMGQIRDRARDNAQRLARIRERIEAGREPAQSDDAAWLAYYERQLATCRAVVVEGVSKRAAQRLQSAGEPATK